MLHYNITILIFTGNWNKYCSVYQDAWYGRSIEGDITIIATGETSQAITSLTILTSLAFITSLLLSLEKFHWKQANQVKQVNQVN